MFDKVIEVISQLLRIDAKKLTPTTHLKNDLNLDSLVILEIVLELESVFDIEIDDQEVAKFFTIHDIVTTVESK